MACNCGSVSEKKYAKRWDAGTGSVADCKITSNGPFKDQTMGAICKDSNLDTLDIEQLCRLKGTLDYWKSWSWIKASGSAQSEVAKFREAVCERIEKTKPSTPKELCEELLTTDSDKQREKENCDNTTHRWSWNACACNKRTTPNIIDNEDDKTAIQGCMDQSAENYVEGATIPEQCEYEVKIPLLNEYIFCNDAGCGVGEATTKNTVSRGENIILVRPTGGLSPYDYIKDIKDAIYEVVKEYKNQLYPIRGIGFYSEDKNNYLHDLAQALTIMLLRNKSQLEDYDNFPYDYVSIYGGAIGIPFGTVKLTINDAWEDNIKNVVTAAKIFNAKNNFTKLLQIASNNNLGFDLDFLENTFDKDVDWLNNNIKYNGYIVSNDGRIRLIEHKEGLGMVLNEHRKPRGLVNILK